MSYGNNSRNIANLLKQDLQPFKLAALNRSNNNIKSRVASKNVEPLLATNKSVLQIDSNDDLLAPELMTQRKSYRLKSSRKTNDTQPKNNIFEINDQINNHYQNSIQGLAIRLDQIVEYYDQKHSHLQQHLLDRVNGLQNLIMKETPQFDNTQLQPELSQFRNNILSLMRKQEMQAQKIEKLQNKIHNKSIFKEKTVKDDPKEKQKITVLFLEVVRVSDALEKIQKNVGNTGQNYEARIQQLEHKLRNSEKNVSILSQRNISGSQLVTDLGDKVMDRLQSAENNLLILGKQRIKDRQTINQLLSQNQRIGQDMEAFLHNLQGDYQNKLESRISDTVNRLMAEHQSRINSQEQIKRSLDLRERINQEKHNQQKYQSKTRYDNMDAMMRQQFQKKQQNLRKLQNILENQIKNMHKIFNTQVQSRKQQEENTKNTVKKVQQNFRTEYDIYKSHQNDVLDKIGELVKEQVQVRVKSQINLKKLTSQIANQLITDISQVREALQMSNKKISMSIKEIIADSSQKNGQLSHYVDGEIKKVADVMGERYNKMKAIFTKLAQQLKEQVMNSQGNRQNVEKRLNRLEDNFQRLKTQLSGQIDEFYNDIESQMKQDRQYVQTFVFKKNNDLTIKVNKLQEQFMKNFTYLKGNIKESKELISSKMPKSRQGKSVQSEQQLKELRTIVFNIKSLTEQLRQQNIDTFDRFRAELKGRQSTSRQDNYQKQRIINEKLDKNATEIDFLQHKNQQLAIKVNSLTADGDSNTILANQRVKKLGDEVDSLNFKVKQLEFDYSQNKVKHSEIDKVLVELRDKK